MEISELLGKTISVITNNEHEIIFTLDNGDKYIMHHIQDCCESVTVDDIEGELSDLIGSPILQAEESTSDINPDGYTVDCQDDSFTWSFYKLATIKGYVTIRWYGESNGCYSESVYFEKL